MKKIILIVSFLIMGCSQKSNDMEIEIMNYAMALDSNSNFVIHPLDYSIIDGNGNAQSINRSRRDNEKKFIQYTVNEKTVNDIAAGMRNLDDKYYLLKEEDFTNELYCGVDKYTRVRIKFKSRKDITFVYLNRGLKTTKYADFYKLNAEFEANKSKGKKMADKDTLKLLNAQKDFVLFTARFKGDLLFPSDMSRAVFPKK